MNSRSIGLVAALAVVVALVAGVAVLASGSGPAAFKVGSHETSQRDVDDELRALAENQVLRDMLNQARAQGQNIAPIGVTDGSVTASTGSGWVGLRIGQEVARQEVARRRPQGHEHGSQAGQAVRVRVTERRAGVRGDAGVVPPPRRRRVDVRRCARSPAPRQPAACAPRGSRCAVPVGSLRVAHPGRDAGASRCDRGAARRRRRLRGAREGKVDRHLRLRRWAARLSR